MKIKTKRATLEEVLARPQPKHKNPKRPHMLWRTLIRLLSWFDLRATHFSYVRRDMEKAGKGPCLIL